MRLKRRLAVSLRPGALPCWCPDVCRPFRWRLNLEHPYLDHPWSWTTGAPTPGRNISGASPMRRNACPVAALNPQSHSMCFGVRFCNSAPHPITTHLSGASC